MKKTIFIFFLFLSVSIFAQKVQNQLVEASCGMCQFKVKSAKGCSVYVKIEGNFYPVKGMDEKVFGDSHADDGYCNAVKKAYVSGEIKKGKFYATAFKYQDS